MPSDVPVVKVEGTRAWGAEVVLYDRATTDREALGAELAAERGLALVPPYDHEEVIAGQGTLGLEIAAQAAEAGVTRADVIVPNGLDIRRFEAPHEFQHQHNLIKGTLHKFVMGHFFPSYSFDLDRTLYFFTAGGTSTRTRGSTSISKRCIA